MSTGLDLPFPYNQATAWFAAFRPAMLAGGKIRAYLCPSVVNLKI